MKLKYYLRGVGIGIVVTAIILSVTKKPEKLTDAQIKLRALELGMVEESVLSDLNNKEDTINNEKTTDEIKKDTTDNEKLQPEDADFDESEDLEESEETSSEEAEDEEQENPQEVTKEDTVSDEGNGNVIEDNKTDSEVKQEEVAEPVETENENVMAETQPEKIENYIVITVESGNDSMVISQKLFEAGLVNSAAEYNRFLVANGYDRRLRTGNHEIPANATNEEMAKILCGIL